MSPHPLKPGPSRRRTTDDSLLDDVHDKHDVGGRKQHGGYDYEGGDIAGAPGYVSGMPTAL